MESTTAVYDLNEEWNRIQQESLLSCACGVCKHWKVGRGANLERIVTFDGELHIEIRQRVVAESLRQLHAG